MNFVDEVTVNAQPQRKRDDEGPENCVQTGETIPQTVGEYHRGRSVVYKTNKRNENRALSLEETYGTVMQRVLFESKTTEMEQSETRNGTIGMNL